MDTPTNEEGKAAQPARDAAPVRPAKRRFARWLAASFASLVLMAGALVALVVWALHSASGSAWLVTLVPQLQVLAPRGSLLGDFAAQRIEITLPGTGGVLRLDAPRWQALAATGGDHGRWLHLTIAALHVDRITLLRSDQPAPASSEPASPPRTLRLPLEIEIREASVDDLRLGANDAALALRGLRARVHLGDAGGALHRLDALAASYDKARATGHLAIAADPPFALDATLALASADALPPWQAEVAAAGPLEALAVSATARVSPSSAHPAQSLAARALVKPFAAWPLGELRVSTSALDLAAFSSAAPATSLSGQATLATSGIDRPAIVSIELRNDRAGRWNEGLLPLRQLRAELRGRPDDRSALDLQTLFADLGTTRLDGGRITARGRWTADRWTTDVELDKVRPAALDAHAPETTLSGKAALVGTGFAAAKAEARTVSLVADVSGPLEDHRLPHAAPRLARLHIDARGNGREIELRSAKATLGGASATLSASATRSTDSTPWRVAGKGTLADFDPAPWWPGRTDALLSRGVNRLNVKSTFDLALPASTPAGALPLLAALRGKASLTLLDSVLAGVPLEGEASFANGDGTAQPKLDLVAAGNHVHVEGQVAASGSRDHWQATISATELARLSVLVRAPGAAASAPALAGTLTATARVEGRWPELTSTGDMHGATLRFASIGIRRAEGRWQLGSAADAPLDGALSLDGVSVSSRQLERVRASVSGTARAHRARLRIDSDALPPEWADALAAPGPTAGAAAASAASTAPSQSAAAGRSALVIDVEGGLVDAGGERAAGWSGTVHELLAQAAAPPARTWLHARELRGQAFWSGGPPRASLEPGSAEVLGARLHWSRASWQGGDASGAAPRLELQAQIDPLPIAPLLLNLQPGFGWGGDLTIGARIDVHGSPAATVDVRIERAAGDLTVTDEYGTQSLGFSELRFVLAADAGLWSASATVAGAAFGAASGSLTARTHSSAAWPDAATPIEGQLDLRIANLGAWGRWLPAGWRLSGDAHGSASIAGRFGAPEYTGRIEASNLGVRNFVQGVNVTDGSFAIALQGSTAHIEHFDAKGGAGSVTVAGDASFGSAPAARLELGADKFELLGRVDRRLVTSGKAAVRLDASSLDLDGEFRIDEGLIDFTRSDAPALGDDVEVVRRPTVAAASAAPLPTPGATSRAVKLDLRVAMGEKLRVRGRGLDAGLRGDLHLTSAGGPLLVNGTLRAVDGSYQAYAQKLSVDRGVLTFVGPIENPRLDIEATRPNLDVRVGVDVTGPAQNPRIRLFSEPDMSDIDKLSWLLLGRASEGAGSNDMALLQSAALALLSGEGPGVSDKLTHAIGLDTISVRQETEGDAKETIVSLGKQISKRWYIGYERGLNATTGSWQLIYRLAQRFTVRAQVGGEDSLDLIWTLRWN
jgi:translocation and assembly module TamB